MDKTRIIIGTDGQGEASKGVYDFIDNIDLFKFLKDSEIGELVEFDKPEQGVREHRSGDKTNLILQVTNWWLSDNSGLRDILLNLLAAYIYDAITKGRKKEVRLRITKQKNISEFVNIDIECNSENLSDIKGIIKDALD